MPYENIMEQVVEQEYEKIKDTLDCCTCPVCRDDIIAYALNRLPPQYVVTHLGRKASEIMMTCQQNSTDIRITICQAADHIRSHPRH